MVQSTFPGSQCSFLPILTIYDHFVPIFLDFFRQGPLNRAGIFLRCIKRIPFFELSKSTCWQFFRFFTLRGDFYDYGVVKSYPEWKKCLKKIPNKKLKDWTKWNRKMGDISFNITSGAFGDTLLYLLVYFLRGGSAIDGATPSNLLQPFPLFYIILE